MNQLDVAALDEVLEGERCWEAVIVCPNGDGCKEGDYNLLHQKPQPFRKAKCAGRPGKRGFCSFFRPAGFINASALQHSRSILHDDG